MYEKESIHKYFIQNINKDYYKKGYKPSEHILTFECEELLKLLDDENSLSEFKKLRGYVGDISLKGYEDFCKSSATGIEYGSSRYSVFTSQNLLLFLSVIIFTPVGVLIAAKVFGSLVIVLGVLSFIAIPWLMLSLITERCVWIKSLWRYLMFSVIGAGTGSIFIYILHNTGGFGAGWWEIIQSCGRYCY